MTNSTDHVTSYLTEDLKNFLSSLKINFVFGFREMMYDS